MVESALELPLAKPRLRGWSHQIAFFISLAACAVLLSVVREGRPFALVYSVTLTLLFGVSALYHRPNWQPHTRMVMRRLDHSAIYLLIAGSYTPMSRVLPGHSMIAMLAVAWGGAVLGMLQAVFWVRAPKPVLALTYVVLGWALVWFIPEIYAAVGLGVVIWIGVGGALYTAGAVIFSLRRPNPWPAVFGFHEIFHLLVILAAAAHFVAISTFLLRPVA